MYLIRLDDASEHMDISKWNKIEEILDKYSIKPIVGVIPNNEDSGLTSNYDEDDKFWDKVMNWQCKGWDIALHGYNHVTSSPSGGINPIHNRSEFAGLSLDLQSEKIKKGISILNSKGINTKIFFAPSHTYDANTLAALKKESNIRIVSDTIADNIYFENDIFFIPLQSGHAMKLPFKLVTFCYHPNTMGNNDFDELEKFIQLNHREFTCISDIEFKKRKKTIYDKLLNWIYFKMRVIRKKFNI
jgi:predicted deacetylase